MSSFDTVLARFEGAWTRSAACGGRRWSDGTALQAEISAAPTLRTLLLIDTRSASRLSDAVASIVASSTSHVTVVALPSLPALWPYAALSGGASPDELRRVAQDEALDLLRRAVNQLPLGIAVEHRLLSGWRDVVALLRERAFDVAVLAASPGRRARRAIAAAGGTVGTALVVA
jgi:hypothetical protein